MFSKYYKNRSLCDWQGSPSTASSEWKTFCSLSSAAFDCFHCTGIDGRLNAGFNGESRRNTCTNANVSFYIQFQFAKFKCDLSYLKWFFRYCNYNGRGISISNNGTLWIANSLLYKLWFQHYFDKHKKTSANVWTSWNCSLSVATVGTKWRSDAQSRALRCVLCDSKWCTRRLKPNAMNKWKKSFYMLYFKWKWNFNVFTQCFFHLLYTLFLEV